MFNNIKWLNLPEINIKSILELLILTFIIYKFIISFKNKKAYSLFKGIVILFIFYMIAKMLDFYTFLWIFDKSTIIIGISLIISFQPEIRKIIESIGNKSLNNINFLQKKDIYYKISDRSVIEIINAVKVMSEAKTGALILIEQKNSLNDYVKTGINLNADITSQLLINIFEHNTPLHDGALIINDDKIIAATCYLPLTQDNDVNKSLGTRHRAALGVSELVDCYVIVVSEETGNISITKDGLLHHNLNLKELEQFLRKSQMNEILPKKKLWKGFLNEK